ncbi:sugar nucleotide-binding protein, partial [Candidatus Sumerlaeota bacterium]|nr:sugar nucleotide-binding protein [Candidatus Sumerlaeota bacterium]
MRLMTDNPKLLVTGLSGLIGSRVAGLLHKRFELVSFDITEGIDITNRKKLAEAVARHEGATVLAHLAAYTDVSRAHGQTGDKSGPCYKINVAGTENVVKVCEETGLHLIHVSTDFVFDGEKPAKSGPYTEEDHPKPIEWYGKTKLMAEEAVRKSQDWTIIRIAYPYVAGPAPRPDLVQNIYAKLVEGLEVSLFTDQVITPTLADDVAQGIGLLARLRPAREVYHLVGSSPMTPF